MLAHPREIGDPVAASEISYGSNPGQQPEVKAHYPGERTRKRHLRTLVRKSRIYRTDSKVSENRVRRRDHGQFSFRTRKRTNVPAPFMSGVRKTYFRVQTPTGGRSRRICEAICDPKRSIHAWIVS